MPPTRDMPYFPGMYFQTRSRFARVGALWLAASVGLFLLSVGGHAATEERPWVGVPGWSGGSGHQPWHAHFLHGAPPSPGLERDLCAICLAHGNARALDAAAGLSHPGDGLQRWIATPGPSRVLVRPAIQPPSRAPPQG